MPTTSKQFLAIVPAAGVGRRMQSDRPKQYLKIAGQTILEHTINKLLSLPQIDKVIVPISPEDGYFASLPLSQNPHVIRVDGGKERADSVLAGLNYIEKNYASSWVLVHDAARPCVRQADIEKLMSQAVAHSVGAILACPVRDTMKRAIAGSDDIAHTVERQQLWHALTPQMFKTELLAQALKQALAQHVEITDEASALEFLGYTPGLVRGAADNIKVTQPEDLALAEFYLSRNKDR